MAFLCPSRLGKTKTKRGFYDPMMGRITGSDSIETLVKLELGKQNANNPETRRIILQSFTGYAPEEVSVKQGQKVHILFREGDWAYVLTHDKKEGYVPFTYCARIGKPPSYRAPKLNKDKEKLLTQHGIDLNDNDTCIQEIDTTLREPNDESYYSEFVSDSFVSGEWSEEPGKDQPGTDSYEGQIITTGLVKLDDSSSLEEIHTSLRDDQIQDHHSQVNTFNAVHTNRESSCQSVIINKPKADGLSEHIATAFNKVPQGRYLVLYDFQGYYEDDASVKQADIVTVLDMDDSDWFWVQKTDNSEGFVPSNFLFRLGLLLPETKQLASSTNEIFERDQNSLAANQHKLRNSPALNSPAEMPINMVKNDIQKGHYFEIRQDERQHYDSPKPQSRGDQNSSAISRNITCEPITTKSGTPQGFRLYSSTPKSSPSLPQYCKFNFETNGSNPSTVNSQTSNEIRSQFPNSHNNVSDIDINGHTGDTPKFNTTEELYPPPPEFSNSSDSSFGTFHDASHSEMPINTDENVDQLHSSHVRYQSEPSQHTNRNDQSGNENLRMNMTKNLPIEATANGCSKHSNNNTAEVRYRTRSNDAKNRARPKSTPPALAFNNNHASQTGSSIAPTNQYHKDGSQNQHYDPHLNGRRLSGHQSERLTPRTNYNYSPTYHSSVWKPYTQCNSPENDMHFDFEISASAFQKPVSNRTDKSDFTRYEKQPETSVHKPKQNHMKFSHETPYYPSGVYNIRSTTDNTVKKVPENNTVRKLSDEENQDLYRKLDIIQNSYDDDCNLRVKNENSKALNANNGKSREGKQTDGAKDCLVQAKHHQPSSSMTAQHNHIFQENKQELSKTSPSHTINKHGVNHNRNEHEIRANNSKSVNSVAKKEDIYKPVLNHINYESNIQNETNINAKSVKPTKDKPTGIQTKSKPENSAGVSNGIHMDHTPGQTASNQTCPSNDKKMCDATQKHIKQTTNQGMTEFVSQFDYKATSKTDLPLKRGEVVHVSLEDQTNKHWYWVYSPKLRKHGYVPRNYVQEPQVTII